MVRRRIYDEAQSAMAQHRWLESEKAGYDLGLQAEDSWSRKHWSRFYRERFLSHLHGTAFYEELGEGCHGALSNDLSVEPDLMSSVTDKIRDGAENLDVLCWAVREHLPVDEILRVLKAVDLNGRRLPPPH